VTGFDIHFQHTSKAAGLMACKDYGATCYFAISERLVVKGGIELVSYIFTFTHSSVCIITFRRTAEVHELT